MQTIALISAKGGVGKSSLTFHLGGTLARVGQKVLLVDSDAQSSLTQGFFGAGAMRSLDPNSTIAAAWSGSPLPEQIIHPTGFDRLSIIPGHQSAAMWDSPIIHERRDRLSCIDDVLRAASDDFDVCLIDCPPQMYASSYAAMIAASYVIVPVQCEDYGSTGMVTVNRVIREINSHIGRPCVLGYVLSMFNKSLGIHQVYAQHLRETHGQTVFDNPIPLLATYKEAVSARTPISHFKPKSAAAKVMAELASEINARLNVHAEAA
jgi:chromosome partitioning protein